MSAQGVPRPHSGRRLCVREDCAHMGLSFTLPDSLAYFVGASLLVASCLYLTAHSHSYADVAYRRGARMPKFLTFLPHYLFFNRPTFRHRRLEERGRCLRTDRQTGRMIGRHDTRNDCVTLYPPTHPPITSAMIPEKARTYLDSF